MWSQLYDLYMEEKGVILLGNLYLIPFKSENPCRICDHEEFQWNGNRPEYNIREEK